jgi:glycine/D-amino acid oxidase-like deaminating enzyme
VDDLTRRASCALARAAALRGAEILKGMPAISFDLSGGEVRAVIAPDGSHRADWFVVAAVRGAGRSPPPRSRRSTSGHSAATSRPSTPAMTRLTRSVFWSAGSLVPKTDGLVIIGGTPCDPHGAGAEVGDAGADLGGTTAGHRQRDANRGTRCGDAKPDRRRRPPPQGPPIVARREGEHEREPWFPSRKKKRRGSTDPRRVTNLGND